MVTVGRIDVLYPLPPFVILIDSIDKKLEPLIELVIVSGVRARPDARRRPAREARGCGRSLGRRFPRRRLFLRGEGTEPRQRPAARG